MGMPEPTPANNHPRSWYDGGEIIMFKKTPKLSVFAKNV